jgi:hypothetical protein
MSSNTTTPKTVLMLCTISCTTLVETFNHSWNLWYKLLRVGKRNWLSYALAISIVSKSGQHSLLLDLVSP